MGLLGTAAKALLSSSGAPKKAESKKLEMSSVDAPDIEKVEGPDFSVEQPSDDFQEVQSQPSVQSSESADVDETGIGGTAEVTGEERPEVTGEERPEVEGKVESPLVEKVEEMKAPQDTGAFDFEGWMNAQNGIYVSPENYSEAQERYRSKDTSGSVSKATSGSTMKGETSNPTSNEPKFFDFEGWMDALDTKYVSPEEYSSKDTDLEKKIAEDPDMSQKGKETLFAGTPMEEEVDELKDENPGNDEIDEQKAEKTKPEDWKENVDKLDPDDLDSLFENLGDDASGEFSAFLEKAEKEERKRWIYDGIDMNPFWDTLKTLPLEDREDVKAWMEYTNYVKTGYTYSSSEIWNAANRAWEKGEDGQEVMNEMKRVNSKNGTHLLNLSSPEDLKESNWHEVMERLNGPDREEFLKEIRNDLSSFGVQPLKEVNEEKRQEKLNEKLERMAKQNAESGKELAKVGVDDRTNNEWTESPGGTMKGDWSSRDDDLTVSQNYNNWEGVKEEKEEKEKMDFSKVKELLGELKFSASSSATPYSMKSAGGGSGKVDNPLEDVASSASNIEDEGSPSSENLSEEGPESSSVSSDDLIGGDFEQRDEGKDWRETTSNLASKVQALTGVNPFEESASATGASSPSERIDRIVSRVSTPMAYKSTQNSIGYTKTGGGATSRGDSIVRNGKVIKTAREGKAEQVFKQILAESKSWPVEDDEHVKREGSVAIFVEGQDVAVKIGSNSKKNFTGLSPEQVDVVASVL